jgi:hypothetical protein
MPLEDVGQDHMDLSESDSPIYATLHCLLSRIPQEQTLYYEANPATNKKV